MPVSSVLDLIFRTKKTGTGGREARQEVTDLSKALQDMAKDTAGVLAMSTAGIAGYLQVLNLADLGYQFQRSSLALEAYAGSADEAARATDLVSQAADGALSRFAATQNAARLFSMGLASSAEEAERLTRIAVTLGTSMGRGPQEAFEEFTLLLANQSILRLDTFGISSGRVRQRMEELANQGIAPADRQARFLIATLEEAEQKLAALEAAGYQSSTSIERMRAAFEDSKLAAAEWVAGIIDVGLQAEGPARTSLYGFTRAQEEVEGQTEATARTIRDDLLPAIEGAGETARRFPAPPAELQVWRADLGAIAAEAAHMRWAFDEANTGLSGMITSFRDNMAWISGGGLELQEAAEGVMRAFQRGAITEDEATQLLQPIQAAALGLQEEIGQISMTDAQRQLVDEYGLGWGEARDAIAEARSNIENLPEEVRTQIRVAVQWQITGGLGRGEGPGGQHGLSMVVPQGFPNDTYNVRASSGERVIVQTPEQQRGGGGGLSIGQLIVNTELDEQILLTKFRRLLT